MEEEEEEAALQLALTSPCVEQPAIDLLLCSLFRRCQQLGIPVPSSALPPPVSQEPPRSILSARDLSRISSLSVRATTSAEGDVGFGKGATRPTEPGVTTTTTLLARCRPAAAAVTATTAAATTFALPAAAPRRITRSTASTRRRLQLQTCTAPQSQFRCYMSRPSTRPSSVPVFLIRRLSRNQNVSKN